VSLPKGKWLFSLKYGLIRALEKPRKFPSVIFSSYCKTVLVLGLRISCAFKLDKICKENKTLGHGVTRAFNELMVEI
jgi:hypothetical protein